MLAELRVDERTCGTCLANPAIDTAERAAMLERLFSGRAQRRV